MAKKVEKWGTDFRLDEVFLVTLTNRGGAMVALSNYGARIVSVVVPDANGKMDNVVLGYDTLEGYLEGCEYFGATVGRFANRIANAQFTLDNHTYTLDANAGKHHLHGGKVGFSHRTWRMEEAEGDNIAKFSIVSPAGEGGFPGELVSTVTYIWDDSNTLRIVIDAIADAKTIVNYTQHSYFNLGGEGSGVVDSHLLEVKASNYLSTDDALVPTGELVCVDGSPLDFRKAKLLSDALKSNATPIAVANGLDHCWVIDSWSSELVEVACLSHPISGRAMRVRTTFPGIQVYTSNGLDGGVPGRAGHVYGHRDAVCLEPQFFPDSPNHSNFPSCVLLPNEKFTHIIEYSFT